MLICQDLNCMLMKANGKVHQCSKNGVWPLLSISLKTASAMFCFSGINIELIWHGLQIMKLMWGLFNSKIMNKKLKSHKHGRICVKILAKLLMKNKLNKIGIGHQMKMTHLKLLTFWERVVLSLSHWSIQGTVLLMI